MSVEQTSQLIQLILNSVLMSVACALVVGSLTARHGTINDQLQALSRKDEEEVRVGRSNSALELSRSRSQRHQLRRLQYRYQISRYSVIAAYYALLFCIVSCLALTLRGIIQWNVLISLALGLFVLGVATLLLAIGLTLIDWHLGDRPLLDEATRLLSFGNGSGRSRLRSGSRRSAIGVQGAIDKTTRPKIRVG